MYLESILINHFKSGFSIVEFVLDMTGKIVDPTVVKSSGQQFDHLVLNSLDELDLRNEKIENLKIFSCYKFDEKYSCQTVLQTVFRAYAIISQIGS